MKLKNENEMNAYKDGIDAGHRINKYENCEDMG